MSMKEALVAQAALITALRDPACYPHEVDTILHIETHISHVLLAGEYVYKIKKPLDLGFLDFSTLAARWFYCEEELRLNRRYAPELYLDVVSIRGHIDAPLVREMSVASPDGDVIEYAVRMRRFPQEALFDRMADEGTLDARHIASLAAVVARFHDQAAHVRITDAFGTARAIEEPMRQNFEQLRPLLTEVDERQMLATIERWSVATHAALMPVFEMRRVEAKVRECHGDLHLANVAWVDDAALPFDCIEFNANLRWIDVQNEIAFTIMDLYARGLKVLALHFLNAYLEHSGDYEGIAVLNAYLVYRAMVRAKVARLRAEEKPTEHAGEAVQRAAVADFALHLDLAWRLTQRRARALVIVHGLSGSGKTVLSGALAGAIGALRLRSDIERKRVAGLDALASSDSAVGADLYSEGATLATYAELTLNARLILEAGWPVIVDAACLERWQRETFRALARELDVPFLIVSCVAAEAVLRERVVNRKATGHDASEAGLEVLVHQLQTAEPLVPEEQPLLVVDTGSEATISSVERIAALLPQNVAAVCE